MSVIISEVEGLREAAMAMRKQQDGFTEIYQVFDEAKRAIGPADTLDTVVLLARVKRDEGFTRIYESMGFNDDPVHQQQLVDQARNGVNQAVDLTAPLLGRVLLPPYDVYEQPSRRTHRELIAEHGASIAVLARIVTYEQVVTGIETNGDSESARQARIQQWLYGSAHNLLLRGNNGYYRVSNAMNAARQEAINERERRGKVWLRRAAAGYIWTLTHNSDNLRAATGTGVRLATARLAPDIARESVLMTP